MRVVPRRGFSRSQLGKLAHTRRCLACVAAGGPGGGAIVASSGSAAAATAPAVATAADAAGTSGAMCRTSSEQAEWEELSAAQRAAAAVLGWRSKRAWDYGEGGAGAKAWGGLSAVERGAAEALGGARDRDGPMEAPTGLARFVNQG
jgi:hypothetical protein